MRLKALARVKGQTFNQDPVSLVQSRPRLRALQVVGEAQGPVVLRTRAAGLRCAGMKAEVLHVYCRRIWNSLHFSLIPLHLPKFQLTL